MENTKTPRRDLMVEIGLENSVVFENPDYDSAIIGYDANDNRIIYDFEKMVEHLMSADGMEYDEAVEFIEYNTLRAIPYAGHLSPIVLQSIEDYLPYHNESDIEVSYEFDAKYHLNKCIDWTQKWFNTNAKGHKAVLGMSGGKDSTVAAAILVRALGADNVIGVAMPSGNQSLNDADKICEHLGIKFLNTNITESVMGISNEVTKALGNVSEQTQTNIPPRIRMTMLYAIAQSCNGIVINTCNLSESYIGFETLYGDLAGSMSPIKNLTATEIIALGDEMGLPYEWVHKTPDDGLPFSSPDEVKFGFTYNSLDNWIRTSKIPDNADDVEKIMAKHHSSKFKRDIVNIPAYDPGFNK